MNASAHISEPGDRIRLKALGILVFVFAITVASIVLLIVSGKLISGVAGNEAEVLIYILRLLILYAIILLIISLIYYWAPAKKFRLGFISPGAFLACNLSILASVALATFFSNFDNYNTLYGTLGSIPIFLIWIFANCLALLAGFELNAIIAAGKLAMIADTEKEKQ